MLRELSKTLPLALLISAALLYPIVGGTLGWDPRDWSAQIERQQQVAADVRLEECRQVLKENSDVSSG